MWSSHSKNTLRRWTLSQDSPCTPPRRNQREDAPSGTLQFGAGVSAGSQPPAPPQLVAAGVRAAQCLRANGLPAVRDPTPDTPFTPGHGFSLTDQDFGGSWPVGGKANPAVRAALQACRGLLDKEIEASTLSSLSHD